MNEELKQTPKKPRRRRRWLAILPLALLVIVVGGYFVVTSSWFIRSVVLPMVAQRAGLTMAVGEVDFSPFKHITLHDLVITGPAPENDTITLGSMGVGYSIGELLGDVPTVRNIDVTSVDAALTIREDGTIALLAGMPPSESETSSEFRLGSFVLLDADVTVVDHSTDPHDPLMAQAHIASAEVSNLSTTTGVEHLQFATSQIALSQGNHTQIGGGQISLAGEFQLQPNGGIAVNASGNAGGFSGTWRGTPVDEVLCALNAATSMDDEGVVTIDDCAVVLSRGSQVLGRLAVTGQHSTASGDGDFHLTLSDISDETLELVMARPGGVDFGDCRIAADVDLSLRDGGNTVATEGSLSVDHLSVLVPEISDQRTPLLDLVIDTSSEINLAAQTLHLTTLTALCEMDSRSLLSMSIPQPATLAWGDQASDSIPASSVNFEITQLDLARIRPLMPSDIAAQVRSGVVNANGRIDIATGGQEVSFVGHLSADQMSVAPGGDPIPPVNFQSDLNLTTNLANSHITVQRGDVSIQRGSQSGSFSATGECNLASLDGTFQVQADGLDVTLPLTLMSSVLGEEFPTVRSGDVTTDLTITLANGGAQTSVSGTASWSNLDAVVPQVSSRRVPAPSGSMVCSVSLNGDDLEIERLDVNLGQQRGQVALTGSFTEGIQVTARGLTAAPFVQYIEGLPVRIDDGQIDGEGTVEFPADGIRVAFRGTEALRDWGLPGLAESMPAVTSEGDFVVTLQGNEFALPTLNLALTSASRSMGSVNGSVNFNFDTGATRFEGNAIGLDVALISPLLPAQAAESVRSGRLTWGGTADFTPRSDGWSSSANGHFTVQGMQTSLVDEALDAEGSVQATIDATGEALSLDLRQSQVTLVADGTRAGEINATGQMTLAPLTGSMNVTLSDAALGPFLALVPLGIDTTQLAELVADGQQTIEVDWPAQRLEANGELALRNALRVQTAQGSVPLNLNLRNRVEMTESGVQVRDTRVVSRLGNLPPQEITLSADLDFTGQRSSRFDLAGGDVDMTPYLELLGGSEPSAAPSSGPWSVRLPDLPDPGALNLNGHVEFDRVRWGDLDVRQPSLDLAWSRVNRSAPDRQLIVSNATLNLVGPTRSAPVTGEILLMQGGAGSPLEYSVDLQLGMCDFEALTSTFAPGLTNSITGAFAVDRCQLSGTGGYLPRDLNTLQGGIQIQFGEGEFSELPLLDAIVKATHMTDLDRLRFFQGGVVLRPSGDHMRIDTTQPFWVRGDLSLLSATGRVYYTGYQSLSLSIGLNENFPRLGSILQSAGSGLIFPHDTVFPEYLMFPLPIDSSGTWSQPQLTLGAPRLDLLLPGVINNLIN